MPRWVSSRVSGVWMRREASGSRGRPRLSRVSSGTGRERESANSSPFSVAERIVDCAMFWRSGYTGRGRCAWMRPSSVSS